MRKREDRLFKPISLLPPNYKKELSTLRYMKYIVVITAFILMVCAVVFIVTPFLAMSKNKAKNDVQVKIDLIKTEISAMKEYEEKFNLSQKYEGILQQAMGKTPDWDDVLTKIMACKPLQVIMFEFNAADSSAPSSDTSTAKSTEQAVKVVPSVPSQSGYVINMKGVATDTQELSLWVQKIQSLEFVKGVVLGPLNLIDSGYTFDLSVTITDGAQYEPLEGGK